MNQVVKKLCIFLNLPVIQQLFSPIFQAFRSLLSFSIVFFQKFCWQNWRIPSEGKQALY